MGWQPAHGQPDGQAGRGRIRQQAELTPHLAIPTANGALQPAQPALTLGPQIEGLEQAEQIVALQRLGQRGQHVETGVVQQATGPVDQGLIVGGEQYDGQTAVLILGMAHQQADGILLRQAEIADQQSHLALLQGPQAGIAVLYPLAG
ncbi:hypothetical protein D3C71_1634170 [compost metagenome]